MRRALHSVRRGADSPAMDEFLKLGLLLVIVVAIIYAAHLHAKARRRYELIPNLVEAVKGYAAYEREILERVTVLRNKALANNGNAASQAADESALSSGFKGLFAVIEDYPDLKANTHFLALQQELANTEDRIAAARRFYNGNVRDLNVLLESFPASLIGGMFSFQPASYFELDSAVERVVPRVDLP